MPKASNEGAEKMIEIQNITKIYGKQTVLKKVMAKLEEGKIYGLVGGEWKRQNNPYALHLWLHPPDER